jgi:hypothetical protein
MVAQSRGQLEPGDVEELSGVERVTAGDVVEGFGELDNERLMRCLFFID